jgi:hypothetical protein
MFAHHYDTRYDHVPNVIAQYNEKTAHLDRKGSGNGPNGFVAWWNGRCVQNDQRRKPREYYCQSTVVVGFSLDDIQGYIGGDMTVMMQATVSENCQHVFQARTQRCAGEDRKLIIHRHAFNANNDYQGMKPAIVYQNHNSTSCKDGDVVLRSLKVAYNLSHQSKDHLMAKQGLTKKDTK